MCWIFSKAKLTHTQSSARSSWKQLEKFRNVENWAVLVTLPTPFELLASGTQCASTCTLPSCDPLDSCWWTCGLSTSWVKNCRALSLLATAVNICNCVSHSFSMLGLSISGPSTLVAMQLESQGSKYVSQEPQEPQEPGAEPLHQFAWPILESIRPQNTATAGNVWNVFEAPWLSHIPSLETAICLRIFALHKPQAVLCMYRIYPYIKYMSLFTHCEIGAIPRNASSFKDCLRLTAK